MTATAARGTGAWLTIERGPAPLLVSVPHAGTWLPPALAPRLASAWLARKDADWYVDQLYGFATRVGATVLGTAVSRTVIDVNRDASGRSLYPGMVTTELCPTTTFDGEPLYRPGEAPAAGEVSERRQAYYDPYHAALRAELDRLRGLHPAVVLIDAHSIRSAVPRLFDGLLPAFNIGTNSGRSCAPGLVAPLERVVAATGFAWVTNGRFKGGHITRHYGEPERGIHAVQLELAMRTYLDEPAGIDAGSWPPPYAEARASALVATLERVLAACLAFAVAG
jgi:N-formylglutamate deformylase